MYYKPYACLARVKHENKYMIRLEVSKGILDRADRIINAMRPYNQKDSGFIYSCTCNPSGSVSWIFAYNSEKIRFNAAKAMYDAIDDLRSGDKKIESGGMADIWPDSPCVCPYYGK